jgi:hypothetical protein
MAPSLQAPAVAPTLTHAINDGADGLAKGSRVSVHLCLAGSELLLALGDTHQLLAMTLWCFPALTNLLHNTISGDQAYNFMANCSRYM